MPLQSVFLWNARGLMTKLSELKLFLSHPTPSVVCITETHLENWHSPRFPGYMIYRQDRADGYGGLLILVSAHLQQRAADLEPIADGQMQTLAVDTAHMGSWSKILLFYNPCLPITQTEFEHYFSHFPSLGLRISSVAILMPIIHFGAAHIPSQTGQESLFNAVSKTPLLLPNTPGVPTRLDPHSGTGSVLDLFFGSSPYFPYSVSLGLDLGSDHTLLLKSTPQQTPRIKSVPQWSLPQRTRTQEWDSWAVALSNRSIPQGNTPQ
ncbi:hypothetical protein HAZT_HAZT007261 [Hyalella azteca]|uniref:Endonuclease/exonuclease/phosphatase domain-containing protein n=1 Tax=Hyalella azteca TaxID=294128 RepID=A0A6A0H635_HYAAZ|nr:hypothetical protein HAZT_HAZT007261 [Hyalella azteca]